MSAMHITVAICGMVMAGTVGFIFGWLQGLVEAGREQTDRMIALRRIEAADLAAMSASADDDSSEEQKP